MKSVVFLTSVLSAILTWSVIAPTSIQQQPSLEKMKAAKFYLKQYGYLTEIENNSTTSQTLGKLSAAEEQQQFTEALIEFQTFYGLPATGTLDAETMRKMQSPRCGVADNYSLRKGWNITSLTWNFYRASAEENNLASKAFALWQRHVKNLVFNHTFASAKANILISYQDSNHRYRISGDNCSFPDDTVLGHGTFPAEGNDYSEIHINRAKRWTLDENDTDGAATRLFDVLVHEIGHVLGMDHSDVKDAVMYSYYKGGKPIRDLNPDDIAGIQRLYGAPSAAAMPITPRPITTTTHRIPSAATAKPVAGNKTLTFGDVPDLCLLENVKKFIIFKTRMYVFHKQYMWVVDLKKKVYEPPILIRNWFPFLPEDFQELDAVYQEPSGYIIAIVKSTIYIIDPQTLQQTRGSPLHTVYFLPMNSKLNTIFNTYTGKTYVFYDDIYVSEVSYSDQTNYFTIKHRGQRISDSEFAALPTAVESSFRFTNGLLYFFKEDTVYEYDEFTRSVVRAMPATIDIFGIKCSKESMLTQLKSLLLQLTSLVSASLNATNTFN